MSAKSFPIDLDHLERQTLGDRALRREVLALFVGQMTAAAGELAGPSDATRAALAHRIKGSAGGVGARRVAAAAAVLEAAPERPDLAAELQGCIHEALAFIATLDAGESGTAQLTSPAK